MIDIKHAIEVFTRYTSKYDMNNKKINLKHYHTLRVSNISRKIAESLNLDEEHILLAELIGLLHDIGRFEQVKIYDSFKDSDTIDHANLAIDILFNQMMIREFTLDMKYDNLIKKAVYIHNKAVVPDDYTDEEKLYSKIVRDADKIDILYLDSIDEVRFNIISNEISDKVLNSFINKTFISRSDVKTGLDEVLLNIAFIYDLNFTCSYEIIRERNYIGKIIDLISFKDSKTKEIFSKIKKIVNDDLNMAKEVI